MLCLACINWYFFSLVSSSDNRKGWLKDKGNQRDYRMFNPSCQRNVAKFNRTCCHIKRFSRSNHTMHLSHMRCNVRGKLFTFCCFIYILFKQIVRDRLQFRAVYWSDTRKAIQSVSSRRFNSTRICACIIIKSCFRSYFWNVAQIQ